MKKRNIIFGTMLIILILILLYFAIKNFGYIGKIPTGNVDIFNIDCDDNCNCKNTETDNETDSDSDSSTDNSSQTVFKEDTGDLEVYDNDITWNSTSDLRIFSNPAFEFESIIAPGSTNTYQYVINNGNSFDISYNLKYIETNPYKINMQFKLKKNGKYIFGNDNTWVKAEDIEKENITLKKNTHDTYSLEWKWLDSDNDTLVSINSAKYKLKIKINAEGL